MTDEEVIRRLCARAGVLMEDFSVDALSTQPLSRERRLSQLSKLREVGRDISALLAAAEVMARRSEEC
jgi:hypothetical protein